MASLSSLASTSDRPAWPSLWPGGETAIPGLEGVPPQSCRRHRGDGSVRRTDDLISVALWPVDYGARSTTDFMVRRYRTAHPTAEWIANQITQACGWKQVPRYLIRDRDGAYG
jgi:hypothetical protein